MAIIWMAIAALLPFTWAVLLLGEHFALRKLTKRIKMVMRVGSGSTMPGMNDGDWIVIYKRGLPPFWRPSHEETSKSRH